MKIIIRHLFFLLLIFTPIFTWGILFVGVGKEEITPPIGTPSAGYAERKGEGMMGVLDPLLATALVIDNGDKKVVFCSVDHLGFVQEMVQEIIRQVHVQPGLETSEIYIGSSHTHSGGGAYLNIPYIGNSLAGEYNPEITRFYIQKTVAAIVQANERLIPGKIGIGYGMGQNISKYRGSWPIESSPLHDVAIIKVTKLDGSPLAILFNYPLHPTILKSQNRLFSADFVGYARNAIKAYLGSDIEPLYFNGAQGDIIPIITNEEDPLASCSYIGQSLAKTIEEIWNKTETNNSLEITTEKIPYTFTPQTTPFGLLLPMNSYTSEMNLIVLNRLNAFITIPGELSSIYDLKLKKFGKALRFSHVSIFGLTNDAHGYIILPESWRHKTFESALSFGGEHYGESTRERAETLLKNNAQGKKMQEVYSRK